MGHRIAVSEGLAPVEDALAEAGYQVVKLEEGATYDAAVVSGADDNMLGRQERRTTGPVVNAEGLTAEQVVARLRRELQPPGVRRR